MSIPLSPWGPGPDDREQQIKELVEKTDRSIETAEELMRSLDT